jgi:4-aminobutyrate aminotransferase-like enzyme
LFATSVSFLRPIWSKGQGCYLISEEGKRYLDLESGTWCAIFGHGDQGLALALKNQAEDLAHCGSLYLSRTAIQATETLLSIAPPRFSSVVWLASGSEAMDWAMQVARLATGKRKFLVLDCGFLGSTDLPFRGSLHRKEDPDFTFLDTSKYLYNGDLNLEIDEETKNISIPSLRRMILRPGHRSHPGYSPPKFPQGFGRSLPKKRCSPNTG